MRNPNGPSIEEIDDWNDALQDGETVMSKQKYGIRELVKKAEDHVVGILESTDDLAFWGEDFFFSLDDDDQKKLTRAKQIVLNRIGG